MRCRSLGGCPVGAYAEPLTSACTLCNPYCTLCFGGSSAQCSACKSPYALYSTTCYSQCPSGYWNNGTLCQDCSLAPNYCKTCRFSATLLCTACSTGRFLYAADGSCVQNCAAHDLALAGLGNLYGDAATNTCAACDPACTNCFGGLITQCTSCAAGYFLDPTTTTCGQTCPAGYVPLATACQPCTNKW